tara:strand:- start:2387 stop:2575 length:189 start_codon:yes stop_codon:yes gene_type:complete
MYTQKHNKQKNVTKNKDKKNKCEFIQITTENGTNFQTEYKEKKQLPIDHFFTFTEPSMNKNH